MTEEQKRNTGDHLRTEELSACTEHERMSWLRSTMLTKREWQRLMCDSDTDCEAVEGSGVQCPGIARKERIGQDGDGFSRLKTATALPQKSDGEPDRGLGAGRARRFCLGRLRGGVPNADGREEDCFPGRLLRTTAFASARRGSSNGPKAYFG